LLCVPLYQQMPGSPFKQARVAIVDVVKFDLDRLVLVFKALFNQRLIKTHNYNASNYLVKGVLGEVSHFEPYYFLLLIINGSSLISKVIRVKHRRHFLDKACYGFYYVPSSVSPS